MNVLKENKINMNVMQVVFKGLFVISTKFNKRN